MSVRLPTASIPKGSKVDMSTISNMGTKNPDSAEEQKEKTKTILLTKRSTDISQR